MRSAIWLLFVASLATGAHAQDAGSPMETFLRQVDEYVVLHRQLEGPLPPEAVTSDMAQLLRARLALATSIRTAR